MTRHFPGSNYPPGVSESTPRAPWNAPDRSHRHEWRMREGTPILDDGAALFVQDCEYADGEYGEGWQCEETRSYRFEYDTLETPAGETVSLPDIADWAGVPIEVERAVEDVESAAAGDGEGVSWDVNPDPETGFVRLGYDGYTLTFSADG